MKSISNSYSHVVSILRNWLVLVLLSFFSSSFSPFHFCPTSKHNGYKKGAIKRTNIFMITGFQEKSIFFHSHLLRCFVCCSWVCVCVMWCWINTTMTRAERSLLSSHGNFSFTLIQRSMCMWIWAPITQQKLNHNKPIIAYASLRVQPNTLCPAIYSDWIMTSVCECDEEIGLNLSVCLFVCSFVHIRPLLSGLQVHCVSNSHFTRSKHQVHFDTQQFKKEKKRKEPTSSSKSPQIT